MSLKKLVFLGLALVLVLSLLPGCATQVRGQVLSPQVKEPSQSTGTESPAYVASLSELLNYWDGKVKLQDLVDRQPAIDKAHSLIQAAPEVLEVIDTEIIGMDLAGAEAVLASTPDGSVTIVTIPSTPKVKGNKAAIIVAIPETGQPFITGYTTNIFVTDPQGNPVVYPSFFINAWWWFPGHIIWWHYWWYDSHNHPNWYYSWWYWHYRYYLYYDWPWYPWYTWYYSWFYWKYWWYWSTYWLY